MKSLFIAASVLALSLTACTERDAATTDAGTTDMATDADAAAGADAATGDAVMADANASAGAMEPQGYVTQASANDMYEIEAARIAADKAQNGDVKALARMIEADHRKSTAELTRAAREAQPALNLSTEMTAKQQADVAALRQASGAAFDQLYLQQQVAAHTEGLKLVRDYAANGSVAALKQHASTVSGPISMHLERARTLSQQASGR